MTQPPSEDEPTVIMIPTKVSAATSAHTPETSRPAAAAVAAEAVGGEPTVIVGAAVAASTAATASASAASATAPAGGAHTAEIVASARRAGSRRRSVLDAPAGEPIEPLRGSPAAPAIGDKPSRRRDVLGGTFADSLSRTASAGQGLDPADGDPAYDATSTPVAKGPLLAIALLVPVLLLGAGAVIVWRGVDRAIEQSPGLPSIELPKAPSLDGIIERWWPFPSRKPDDRGSPRTGDDARKSAGTRPGASSPPSAPSTATPPSMLPELQERARVRRELGNLADAVRQRLAASGKADAATTIRTLDRALAAHGTRKFEEAVGFYTQVIEKGGEGAEILALRGDALDDKGDHGAAIADFDAALRIDDRFALAYDRRAEAHRHMKQLDRALADAATALRLEPGNASYLRNRGLVHLDRRDHDAAIADFDAAIAARPDSPDAYVNRALAHMRKSDNAAARRDYDKALALAPKNLMARLGSASLHNATAAYDKAKAEVNAILAETPGQADALIERAVASFRSGDADAAIADLTKAIESRPKSVLALRNRAQVHRSKRAWVKVIADFSSAIALAPNDATLFNSRGSAHYEKGDNAAALADLDRAITLDPSLALAYYNRGLAHLRAGGDSLAEADFSSYVARTPGDSDGWRQRGRARERLGNEKGAEDDYTRAIETNGKDPFAYSYRCALLIRDQRYDAAKSDCASAITLRPKLGEALNNLAWIHFKTGAHRDGLPYADRAVEASPDNANAWDTRGHIHEALGDKPRAIADYRAALERDAGLADSKAGLERLGVTP